MKKQLFQRILCWFLVLCMVLPGVPVIHAAHDHAGETDLQLTPYRTDLLVPEEKQEERDPQERVRVSIVLDEPSTVEAGFATMGIAGNLDAMAYRARLKQSQERMEKTISARVLGGEPLEVAWNMTLVGNIISAWVPYGRIDAIRALPGVRTVDLEKQFEPCVTERSEGIAPQVYGSSAMTGSGLLWDSGYTGAGSRIAIIDTGTDTKHQSFDNGAYLYALGQNAAEKGMNLNSYMDSLELLTEEEIARILPELNVSSRSYYVDADDLYVSEKLPFGFNYVDRNLTIDHNSDMEGEHGSHVAGIATANRFIPEGSGYAEARDTVKVMGVAPDAQLITMKVFGQNALYDSDYMAAIEDAIMLNCDSVNLSLGTANPGSPYNNVYDDLLELLEQTDTVVSISAGNAYDWAVYTENGYLYHDDVSLDTVGEPGSYSNAFTVASVQNAGVAGCCFGIGGREFVYVENLGFGNAPMADLDLSGSGTLYDYIFLDGLGYSDEYNGIDVSGKIVMISRGEMNFVDKANVALNRGAAAVVIYNNEAGILNMDVTGLDAYAPVVSISQADAAAIRAMSQDRGNYLSGQVTVSGKRGTSTGGAEYYLMSEYSSWGVPGDLSLKPEITAPGGDIYSIWGSNRVTGGGSDQYEYMSGTSMAAPQVAGMAALMAQVYRENGLAEKSGISARHLAQSLLMSTAQPLYEEASGGNYYSLLKQGAGLARVDLAAQAQSFIQVHGQEDGKVKAELGDDPDRTGVYTVTFTVQNLTNKPAAYTLDADLFRQSTFESYEEPGTVLLDQWTTGLDADVTFTSAAMSAGGQTGRDLNGDGSVTAADADWLLEYLLGNASRLYADGDIDGDGTVNSYDAHLLLAGLSGDVLNVPANSSAEVTVRMALTNQAKEALDAETPNGTYVQAYVYVRSVADAEGNVGTTHSIPVLAFYGNWTDASMFDRATKVELDYGINEHDPYLYEDLGNAINYLTIDYGDGNLYYFGDNPFVDDASYMPERVAFNSSNETRLVSQYFSLIRGAADTRVEITNADTGEVYYQSQTGECYPAYFNINYGWWLDTEFSVDIGWRGTNAYGSPVPEGTRVNVSLVAVPHYYVQEDGGVSYENLGEGSRLTTTMTIDNTAPNVIEVDEARLEEGILTVRARDNEYIAAAALINQSTGKMLSVKSPNQTSRGEEVQVELDLAGVSGGDLLVAVYDYADNMTTCQLELDLPELPRDKFSAIDYDSNTLVDFSSSGRMVELADLATGSYVTAAGYVDGTVYAVTSEETLYAIDDENPSDCSYIGYLDPYGTWQITTVTEMDFNYADGQMYLIFYSSRNREAYPYLATVDLESGQLNVLGEMPIDVLTLAIDGTGTCWSVCYGSSALYQYTPYGVFSGDYTYVGSIGSYSCQMLTTMAWDHDTDELYYAYPGTMLRVNTNNASPEVQFYDDRQLVGMYIRSEGGGDPVDYVDSVQLSHSSIQLMAGGTMRLTATVLPRNASDRTVSWSTSDSSVATVDGQGLVTCMGSGSCTITATSNLDPSVSASCVVTCMEVDKSLCGVLWDENSDTWMVTIDTTDLASYTKLHNQSLGLTPAAATMGQDGRIYVASMESNMESVLYWLDPQTYRPNRIGSSIDCYVDLAPAPGMGDDTLMAINGNSLMLVDTNTGGYYDWFLLFEEHLVGIAYIGTEPFNDGYVDTMLDWYFLIDKNGTVYLLGFMNDNGTYYYMEHDELAPGGVYTRLGIEIEESFFNAAYFDGEMLYFSVFQESENQVSLVAVDVAGGTRNSYLLGDFGNNVWPVVGLMEPGTLGGDIGILGSGGQPIPIEQKFEKQDIRQEKIESLQTGKLEQQTEAPQSAHGSKLGGLHSVAAVPMSSGDARGEVVYVDVTIPAPGPNAQMTVSFDSSMLELTDVTGSGTAFAWNAGNGKVELAVAEYAAMSADAQVARLTFRALQNGVTDVTIDTDVLGREYVDLSERLTLTLDLSGPHEHTYTAAVTAPTCTEQGYTTYTCSCGESYIGDYSDPLGHDMGDWQVIQQPTEDANGIERRTCSRCGYYEDRPYGDVAAKREAFFSDEEWEVLKLVNKERLAQGLNPLTGFDLLQQVGDIRVVELVELFSHTRPDGRDCFSAYDEVGVEYWSAGENIAAGYWDPYDVMDGWMNSSGHRANILDSDFDSVGLGYHYQSNTGYSRYWTQNFRGMYGSFTDYQVVIPQNGQFDVGTSFDEMDIYLVLDYTEDDYDHYLPLTEEMVSITEGSNGMTVSFNVLGLSGTFTVSQGHSHSYTVVVTDPTCTEGGYTTYTCSCGDSYVSDYTDPLGHDWSAWETIQEPTCTEGGIVERCCWRCDAVETVFTDANGHNWSDWNVIEQVTCTEDGKQERTCQNCGDVERVILEAPGHDWSDWDTVEEPTCTDMGLQERFCFRCSETETALLDAIGHDWSDWNTAQEPTCTEDGLQERVCWNCEDVEIVILEATGHDWSDWETTQEPSCTEDGHEERFCINCDETQTNILAAVGHDWTGWVIIEEPTISAPGLKSRMCLRCLYVDLETIPELEHTHAYIPVVTAPTCTDQGYTTYTCECGDSYKADYVEALGHALGDWQTVKAATCTEPGTEQRSCSRCVYTESRQVDATGHSHTAVVTEPTCTDRGYTTYTCACGDSYVSDYVEALGHDLSDWQTVKEPTCTEPGTAQRSCSRCGYTESRQTDAIGHSHTAVVTEPTCTQAGFTTYTCNNCGSSYVSDYVDALGHNYVDGICIRCGAKDPNYQEPAVNPFTDVPEGSFYYQPVLWAVENGITSGTSATTFNPTGDCQRAQVVTFLWRAAGQPEPSSTVNPFVDVKETDFYYKAVLWAVEKGITNGVDATHFGPFAYCNRAQVVTFLYRAMGSPLVSSTNCPFVDVVAGAWYEAPILWAVENGITNGMDATHFGVNVICNRAQVVTFLYRTLA